MGKLRIAQKFRKAAYALQHARTAPFFGFVQGHAGLTGGELRDVERLVGIEAPDIVAAFETEFAKQAGGGEAVSFGAARMAFFALVKTLGIGPGDEVILQGATCAVMVTAILRAGATPVFADIDPDTFGSSPDGIERCVTNRTRMIVAQHSFGIPCNIELISTLARARGIFLLEDCALTLGSTWLGAVVGTFGDAALFSTDHSKPLNTMTGGLVLAKDAALTGRLRKIQAGTPPLPASKQRSLWERVLFERQFCVPQRYGSVALRDIYRTLVSRGGEKPFLGGDFGVEPAAAYPYPARMPAFLARIGIAELNRWPEAAVQRKALLRELLAVVGETPVAMHIPRIYYDARADIVPLRLAWAQEDGKSVRTNLSRLIDVDWTWFMEPIVGQQTALNDYYYSPGSCPISEGLGPNMINLPCNVPVEDVSDLLRQCASLFGCERRTSTITTRKAGTGCYK